MIGVAGPTIGVQYELSVRVTHPEKIASLLLTDVVQYDQQVRICMCVCGWVLCMYVCMYVYACTVCIYALYVCMYICMHMYILYAYDHRSSKVIEL